MEHQKDLNGCGIACIANLLNQPYDSIKEDFEKHFHPVNNGVKTSEIVEYLKRYNLIYKIESCNEQTIFKDKTIVLTVSGKLHPTGHYLLKTSNGWIDPWCDYPSIHNVTACIRSDLPDKPSIQVCPM